MGGFPDHLANEVARLGAKVASIAELLRTPHYTVVYNGPLPAVVTPIDVQPPFTGGVHELADVICHEQIASTQTGVVTRDTAVDGVNPFTPADQADADAKAYANLKLYGIQWCSGGSCAGHGDQTCKPKLSGLKSLGYQTTSAPHASDAQVRTWTLTATVSATITCTCQ